MIRFTEAPAPPRVTKPAAAVDRKAKANAAREAVAETDAHRKRSRTAKPKSAKRKPAK